MKWTFARRYLVSRSSHSVINIIAAVSLVSVAVPVAAMVILLSVFNGFETLVREMYADTDADIEIRAVHRSEAMLPTAENRQRIAQIEGVEALSFVIEQQALVQYNERQCAIALRGADNHYFDVLPAKRQASGGEPRLTLGEIDYLTIGRDVAHSLGIYNLVDQRLTLLTLGGGEVGSLLPLRNMRRHEIMLGGIVNNTQAATLSAVAPLRTLQHLAGHDHATTIMVRASEGYNIDRLRDNIEAEIGSDNIEVVTREEKNTLFYQIMKYEKWAVFAVTLLVLIVASLSIIGTLLMLIIEKRNEQPVLLAMGADMRFIRGIFIREGLLISGIGGVAGIVIGVAIVALQELLHIVKMPSGEFLVDSYPVELHATDIILVLISFVAVAWSVSRIATRTMIKPQRLCNEQ